jgi:hypothetical protein
MTPWLWALLALAGHAASLRLIDAGTRLHYQHYFPPEALVERPVALGVVLIQCVAVAIGGAGLALKSWRWLRDRLSLTAILVIAVFFFATAAAGTRPLTYAAYDAAVSSLYILISLLNVLLVVTSLRRPVSFPWHPSPLALALLVTFTAAVLNVTAYQKHPHIKDEVTYYEQARFFASGAISAPAPPVPEAFEHYLMDFQNGRWFPVTPPGWPALLAIGMYFGVPWLVNPILGGINLMLAAWLFKILFGNELARIGTLLIAVSPWHLFLAMSFMTHTSQLTMALIGAAGIAQSRLTGRWQWALLGGLGLGWMSLIRPLDGVILCAVLGLWALGIGGVRLRIPSLAALALGTALTGSLVFPFNTELTGSPLRFPINAYVARHFAPGMNDLGFGASRGAGWGLDPNPGHSPIDGMINLNLNGHSLNTELFGWATGASLLLGLGLFAGGNARKMLAVIVPVCTVYFFYWYSGGPDYGARYWFLILVPCVGLSLSATAWLKKQAGAEAWRVNAALLLLSASAVISYIPWRATDKYFHYLSMKPVIHEEGKSLVLIGGPEFPNFASGAAYNMPDVISADVIYAWARSPEITQRLIEAFPGRKVYRR